MSNNQLPADRWIKKDRDWSEYPEGTKAKAVMGGHWVRVKRGWKWHLGDTFPSPGGDATGEVCLPVEQLLLDQERIKADANATLKAKGVLGGFIEKRGYLTGYIAGATAENAHFQPMIDALDQFISFHESGLLPAKHVYEKAIAARKQWKEQKEVKPVKESTSIHLSTEEKKKLLAKKVENRIKEAGLQRQEFADLMGVQPSTVTKWLSGEHNFEINTLFEIEKQLNISLFNL